MAALLVKIHEAVNDYMNSSENRALATEIGSEVLQLSRAVVKKHTWDSERAFKFHLAQPARILARSVVYWHKKILRKLKRKTIASRPWTVTFSWNLPLEVFDCFKVVVLVPANGGSVVKNTRAISLQRVLRAYRCTPHTTTNLTPHHLMYGRDPRTKLPQLTEHLHPDDEEVRARDR